MRFTKLALFLLLGTLIGGRMALSQAPDRRTDGRGNRGDGARQGDAGDAGTQYFHQRLSPYGEWGTHASYGEVWRPRVAAGWRPYSTGHWVYTDYGWTWAADESWGWAPFHYGRWYQDSLGWGWVPGNVWAPAWVDWRNGGGYVGWGALPPEAGFSAGVGISFGAALDPSYYCFVPERAILEPHLGGFFVSPERNAEIFRGTSNVHGIAVVNGRVFNQGMSTQRIAQVSGRAVPTERVGNQAAFYRPAAVTNAARQKTSESFVNRPAPRAASAVTRPVPAGSRSANRQAVSTRSARSNALPSATTRGQSRSATEPNQRQAARSAVSRPRTPGANSHHATSPTQGRTNGAIAAHSHTAAVKPPQRRVQRTASRSNSAPRNVASANQARRGTQRSSARPNPASRQAASASPPMRRTQPTSAGSRPPPRRAAAPAQHPARAPAQTKPHQQPPPSHEEQPRGQ